MADDITEISDYRIYTFPRFVFTGVAGLAAVQAATCGSAGSLA